MTAQPRHVRLAASAAWLLAVVGGGAAVLVGAVGLVRNPPTDEFYVLLVCSVFFAARPLEVLRHPSKVFVEVGSAFSLAALYLWGLPAAVVMQALSWTVGNAVRHKPPRAFAFNVGNLSLSITGAWFVMALAGHPYGLNEMVSWRDLWWVPLTWVAHFVVNLGLLAPVLRGDSESAWAGFRSDLPWHVVSESVGFTLSPVVVALVDEGRLTPLLLALALAVVSETYTVTRRSEHEALHDPLTGLANRRRFMQALDRRVQAGSSFVLLLVDLDRFKQVNDGFGHLVGDALLVQAGRRLSAAVRGDDLVARLGGDEFAVLLGERATRREAQEVARRLHSALVRPVHHRGQRFSTGASIGGVVVGRSERIGVDEAYHRADRAMYTVKRTGGGVRLWDPGVEEQQHWPGSGPGEAARAAVGHS